MEDFEDVEGKPLHVGGAEEEDIPPTLHANKPPTGEELRVMQDAVNLYKSSSFKLQIDALLPHVRPKLSRRDPLDRFLLALHTFLLSIPSVPPEHPLVAARKLLKQGVSVPYCLPLPTENTNWKVAFDKPADIALVGSWANGTSVKRKDSLKFAVTLAVEMPQSLFQEKDYQNSRFFQKKAFYLSIIAGAINSAKDILNVDVSYDSISTDPRLTALVLWPINDGSPNDFSKLNACIRIVPAQAFPTTIPLTRLSPTQHNIRITSPDESLSSLPTPLYNTALLRTLHPKFSLLSTHCLKQDARGFVDALTLLRVWANQRGYGEGTRSCIRGFERQGQLWSAVLGLLIEGEEESQKGRKTKRIGRGLSSYQLFKAALDFLAKHDFGNDPLYLKCRKGHRFRPEEYPGHHDAVLVDESSIVNLFAGISLCSLDMLGHDARKSLEALDALSESADLFAEIFLEDKRDLCTRFDTVMRVNLSTAKSRCPSLHQILDRGSQTEALLANLASVLRRGLGNRAKAIAILHPTSVTRPISQSHPSDISVINIGIIHDQEHAFRLVDHGPAAGDADQGAAEEFRGFWGEKAELRRFKDGRIDESVVWEVTTSDEKAQVPSFIVRYLLGWHLGVPNAAIQTWQSSFDFVLKLPEFVTRQIRDTVGIGFRGALLAFGDLVKAMKASGDDLPLSLLNVSAASEYLRYTSVFAPIPQSPAAAYTPVMEIVLEFEKSSRWPDDLLAVQKVKLAFFERIAVALMTSVSGLKATAVVGDGHSGPEIQDQARLEIVMPTGWVFSARIWHDREATLLDRIIDQRKRALPHIARIQEIDSKLYHQALEARHVYTRRFIHAPRHHRAIASLCHRFPAYAGTVRLVKRWLASHWLLRSHISEEAVELICAKFFVGVGKYSTSGAAEKISENVPGSKERGFAMVVGFLRKWKWEDGLVVPLYRGTDSGGPLDVEKVGDVVRSSSNVWTIMTEADEDGHMWTKDGPDITAAHRTRVLANATWGRLLEMESGVLDVKALFVHPTDDYDFVVQLDPAVLPRYHQNISANLESMSSKGRPIDSPVSSRPGFDPAQLFFDDLRFIYADTMKLFYDPLGGDRIGGVWDPSLKNPRPFRVLGNFSSIPAAKETETIKDHKMVVLNEKAVLGEIERMGKMLVKRITAKK